MGQSGILSRNSTVRHSSLEEIFGHNDSVDQIIKKTPVNDSHYNEEEVESSDSSCEEEIRKRKEEIDYENSVTSRNVFESPI